MAESKAKAVIEELEKRYKEKTEKMQAMAKHFASTNFQNEEEDNILKWILDIEEDMQTIEHLLRGDVPKRDAEGNEWWEECPDDEKLFSERGVRELLKIIRGYLTKNIFLSNFSEEEIRIRCKQFATRLNNFIANNYEVLGWDSVDKMKNYGMVVGWLSDTVEAAYNRALNGFTLKQIGTKTSIVQTIDDGKKSPYPAPSSSKGFVRKLFGG